MFYFNIWMTHPTKRARWAQFVAPDSASALALAMAQYSADGWSFGTPINKGTAV